MNHQFAFNYIQACSILQPISWRGNLTKARAKPSHARLRQDQDQWGHSGESRGQPGKLPPPWKAQAKPARESQPELAGPIAPRQEKPRSQPGSLPFENPFQWKHLTSCSACHGRPVSDFLPHAVPSYDLFCWERPCKSRAKSRASLEAQLKKVTDQPWESPAEPALQQSRKLKQLAAR